MLLMRGPLYTEIRWAIELLGPRVRITEMGGYIQLGFLFLVITLGYRRRHEEDLEMTAS